MHSHTNRMFHSQVSATSLRIIISACAMTLMLAATVFTSSAQAQTAACVQLLDSPSAVSGDWDGSCFSEKSPPAGNGDRYARFFVFSLQEETEITIELSSADQDAYLYLMSGWGKDGVVLHSNDDIDRHGSTDSRIVATMEPGLYTIEATTYKAEKRGIFRLTVHGVPQSNQAHIDCFDGAVGAMTSDDLQLVLDCSALRGLQDELSGDVSLNWSSDTELQDWDGLTIEGSPRRVVKIALVDRDLDGSIPMGLQNLDGLIELHLNDNELTGGMPAELGSLPNLADLRLDGNLLEGEISSELGNIASLRRLDLQRNGLTGEIPPELADLPNLTELHLYNNRLTGEIPPALGDLSGLQRLDLRNNRLTGTIPAELGNLSGSPEAETTNAEDNSGGLVLLALGENLLSGQIPPELGKLTALDSLLLDRNQLNGEIPPEIGDLANLTELRLDRNRLTGQIPIELANLTNLVKLQLAGNRVVGCIPDLLQDVENNDLEDTGLPLCGEGDSVPQLTEECVQPLASRSEVSHAWNDSCISEKPPLYGSGDRYARFYTFSLDVETSLAITLSSDDTDTFLYLLEGSGKDGEIVESNDDIVPNVNLNSRIYANLQSGDYTIEATTFSAEKAGDFIVVVENVGSSYFSDGCSAGVAVEDPEANPGLVADCEALMSARDALAGEASLLWSTEVPIGLWPAITMDGDPLRVTEVSLLDHGLTGEIPAELGNLDGLVELHLGLNELSGRIPPELGNLSSLEVLHLWSNELEGEIPAELGSLSELKELHLWYNFLSGPIPSQLGNLSELDELHLDHNLLTGPIPGEFGELEDLTELYLDDNQLTGEIPAELGSLRNLQVLSLWDNRLTGEIPPELGDLDALRQLDLDHNLLSGDIPPELGKLENLELMYLDDNLLTGNIPPELGNLGNLYLLYLWGNLLSGEIPLELGNLTSLQRLTVHDNRLTGEIPEELGELYDLDYFFLKDNHFSGCIPGALRWVSVNDFDEVPLPFCGGEPTGMETCESGIVVADPDANPELVADCETLLSARETLAGSASLVWTAAAPIARWSGITVGGDTKRVTALELPSFALDGEIPTQLGNLDGLETLNFRFNRLSGEIPVELGNLSNLVVLNLLFNRLSGPIPPELASLSNLVELHLHHNRLTGEIPVELGNLSELVELHLDDNQLTGPIPAELGDLSNLEELSLWMNQLSGQIPHELGNIPNLRTLFLTPNNLTGCIPVSLQDVPNNDLSGLGLPFCDDGDAQESAISGVSGAKSAVVPSTDRSAAQDTLKPLGLGDEESLLDAVALCQDIDAHEQLASEHGTHVPPRLEWSDASLDICQALEDRR